VELAKKDYWLLFNDNNLLLKETNNSYEIPAREDIEALADIKLSLAAAQYIGSFDNNAYYAANISTQNIPQCFLFKNIRQVLATLASDQFALVLRAFHILTWIEKNKYCGCCGAALNISKNELTLNCSSCHNIIYPRISPAIIVAVTKDNKLLLARAKNFKTTMYSVLAGFVEPGETLEECISRELNEEVGIEVTNIRYFGSQAWPFPDSLMIAFTAQWAKGDIIIDNNEIIEAGWFSANQLPKIPEPISISRQLIDSFVASQNQ